MYMYIMYMYIYVYIYITYCISKVFNDLDVKEGDREIIDEDDVSPMHESNEFYSPNSFAIIKSYMHLLPLWSGIG